MGGVVQHNEKHRRNPECSYSKFRSFGGKNTELERIWEFWPEFRRNLQPSIKIVPDNIPTGTNHRAGPLLTWESPLSQPKNRGLSNRLQFHKSTHRHTHQHRKASETAKTQATWTSNTASASTRTAKTASLVIPTLQTRSQHHLEVRDIMLLVTSIIDHSMADLPRVWDWAQLQEWALYRHRTEPKTLKWHQCC
jgi:hypothetical protein